MNSNEDTALALNEIVIDVLLDGRKRFLNFLTKRIGNAEVAEDLLQNALKKAIERPTLSTNEGSITAWFYQILKNVVIDYYRSRASEDRKLQNFVQEIERTTEIPYEMETEICACMSTLLPTLKKSYADLIQKIDLDKIPIAQVAKELSMTPNNITVKLHRARKALKLSLERTCGVCTQHGCLDCSCK